MIHRLPVEIGADVGIVTGAFRDDVLAEAIDLGGCPRMPFFPNSSLYSKNYPRNINYIPVVIFFVCLDFGKNCYSRTAS